MSNERPDLSQVSAEVLAYIESLETELEQLRKSNQRSSRQSAPSLDDIPPPEPTEPPTTANIITFTAQGIAKRTPRHLYTRQRRGGMGVFDLDASPDEPPALMTAVDEAQQLILITDQARAFPLPIRDLAEAAVRAKGQSLLDEYVSLRPDESIAVAVPDLNEGYLILVSKRGHVRRLRHHYFGSKLRPATTLYTLSELGPPAAACWTLGERELLILTKEGKGIRFLERLVPANGGLGIRLGKTDEVVAAASVTEESEVFLMAADGKGTVRQMSGFAANKAPGSGGKVAMKTDHLIGGFEVNEGDDIFAISRLSKMIRFPALEVPVKSGVVQGVNCMTLRADEVVAIGSSVVPTV